MATSTNNRQAMRIVVLEDNPDRRERFRDVLSDRFPQFELRFAETSGDAIRLIDEAFEHLAIVALDNDLDVLTTSAGTRIDAGSGVNVAEYLLRRRPAFPVVIHTTNSRAGDEIERRLSETGWSVRRVIPYGDLEWIDEQWFPAVRNLIVETAPTPLEGPSRVADAILTETLNRLHLALNAPDLSAADHSVLTAAITDIQSRLAFPTH